MCEYLLKTILLLGLFENYLNIRFKDPNLEAVRTSLPIVFYCLYCFCVTDMCRS